MQLRVITAVFSFALLAMLCASTTAVAQDDSVVHFDETIDQSGIYVGQTDAGDVAVFLVDSLQRKRGGGSNVKGEMIIRGQGRSVSGTVVNTPAGTATYYPLFGQQLKAVPGQGDAAGGDYELSGSRNDIHAIDTEDGIITSFRHGNGYYEWDPEDRCYNNPDGFDKFTFWSNGDGTYRYEHTYVSWGGGSGTHSSGTASPGS